jgi:NAD(P)-dependent dehydrogenase (short-subunit alcohol dehydrogenase family)
MRVQVKGTLESQMNRRQMRIVLTGATRGLGRELALEFARLGHLVAGCGRSALAIGELQQALGEGHDFAVVDVGSDAQVKQWAGRVLDRFGPPDLLVNNAAVINENANLWEISAAEFDRIIDVNIKGMANVIRHYVPGMVEAGCGVVVNFSSGWGRSTSPRVAPYCATKWAVEGLTMALSQEVPSGLAAVSFNPGIIDTQMLRTCFGDAAAHYPSPREWAKSAVPFLLSLGLGHNGKALSLN